MKKINYLIGDATKPQGEGKKIIAHICNDVGAWGAGFVIAVSNRWRYPEDRYRAMPDYQLGTVMVLEVEQNIYVANMIAQHGVRADAAGKPPVRYDALKEALSRLNTIAEGMNATVHMPRIGAGLAGGDWSIIEQCIEKNVHVPVTVYDLPA